MEEDKGDEREKIGKKREVKEDKTDKKKGRGTKEDKKK